ncbi:unnamed protein product [Gadus morhua 'NCC']
MEKPLSQMDAVMSSPLARLHHHHHHHHHHLSHVHQDRRGLLHLRCTGSSLLSSCVAINASSSPWTMWVSSHAIVLQNHYPKPSCDLHHARRSTGFLSASVTSASHIITFEVIHFIHSPFTCDTALPHVEPSVGTQSISSRGLLSTGGEGEEEEEEGEEEEVNLKHHAHQEEEEEEEEEEEAVEVKLTHHVHKEEEEEASLKHHVHKEEEEEASLKHHVHQEEEEKMEERPLT